MREREGKGGGGGGAQARAAVTGDGRRQGRRVAWGNAAGQIHRLDARI